MYKILFNYGIAVETFVVCADSQLLDFLAYKQDGVITLRYTSLYPAF